MIKVKNLIKDFGRRRAVNGVSFEVERGTVLGFLGPNGAGKTTTIRMIAGYLLPSAGTVTVKGIDVAADPVSAQKNIGYMPENTPLYEDMTVHGFLKFIAEIRGFSGKELDDRVNQVMDRCFLQPVRNQTIDTLSKGYRQRTCLAQTLIHDPDILLLDEPTEGLDPNQKQVVRNMIREMASEKVIMLSTHVLEEVEAICSRAIIISSGKVVADDTPAELKKRSQTYNTVTISAKGTGIAEKISDLSDVKEIETIEKGEGICRMRITPKPGKSLVPMLLTAAQQNKWEIEDLKVDEGRLDDVFRQITTTEDTKEAE